MDYEKVRIWQTHFSVLRPFDTLPIPELVVYETQNTPEYRMDGVNRFEDGAQLVISVAGCGGLKIKDTEYKLLPGKAFIHNHNDHDICYFYPPECKDPWNFIWFAFYGGNSAQLVTEINRNYGYLFDISGDSELLKNLKEYKNYSGEVQILSAFEGAQLVFDILEKLCSPHDEYNHPSSHTAIIAELQNLINFNPGAEMPVEKLAAKFNISREHLSRIFCEETGISLHEYIIRLRLKMAVNLLLQTRLSSKEIADRCGWNDYSNFYRLFKQRFGHTPGSLRKSGIRPQI